MPFLLDTCTISEPTTAMPSNDVIRWFAAQDERNLFLSVITTGELERGIYGLPKSKKRTDLESWFFNDVIPQFQTRMFGIGRRTMTIWAKTSIDLKQKGIVRPIIDSLLEATALEHDLILVTRNVKNFQGSSVTILNPWEA